MRFLITVVTFLFIQLISLQSIAGQSANAAKSYNHQLSTKKNSAYKKAIFEDLPCLQRPVKKCTADHYPLLKTQDQEGLILVSWSPSYPYFSGACFSFIIDHFYNKHVFW